MHRLKQYSVILLKQGFLTLVMFNIFNISYSAGIHWRYADSNDPNYFINSLALYLSLLGALITVVIL